MSFSSKLSQREAVRIIKRELDMHINATTKVKTPLPREIDVKIATPVNSIKLAEFLKATHESGITFEVFTTPTMLHLITHS